MTYANMQIVLFAWQWTTSDRGHLVSRGLIGLTSVKTIVRTVELIARRSRRNTANNAKSDKKKMNKSVRRDTTRHSKTITKLAHTQDNRTEGGRTRGKGSAKSEHSELQKRRDVTMLVTTGQRCRRRRETKRRRWQHRELSYCSPTTLGGPVAKVAGDIFGFEQAVQSPFAHLQSTIQIHVRHKFVNSLNIIFLFTCVNWLTRFWVVNFQNFYVLILFHLNKKQILSGERSLLIFTKMCFKTNSKKKIVIN